MRDYLVLSASLVLTLFSNVEPRARANDLLYLNDEFASAASATQWQQRYAAEPGSANQLERWAINPVDAAGAMLLQPYTSTWYAGYRGSLVYKSVAGDFVFTTHVAVENRAGGGLPESTFSLAGPMIRTPPALAGAPENYVFLSVGYGDENYVTHPGPGPHFEVKTTRSGNSELELSPAQTLDVTLQIARLGDTVVTLYQRPGEEWAVHRVYHRDDFPETLQVGLVAYTDWNKVGTYTPAYHNSHVLSPPIPGDPSSNPAQPFQPDVVAAFDYARYFRPTVPEGLNPATATPAQLLSFLGVAASQPIPPGDLDASGVVDRRDAGVFARHFGVVSGAVWTDGDFDGDGAVSLADLAILQANLSPIAAATDVHALAAAVPEPSGILLAVCALAAVGAGKSGRFSRRFRRRGQSADCAPVSPAIDLADPSDVPPIRHLPAISAMRPTTGGYVWIRIVALPRASRTSLPPTRRTCPRTIRPNRRPRLTTPRFALGRCWASIASSAS